MKKKTFSLIELLAVTVILGIIVALIVNIIPGIRERARRLQCAKNIHGIAIAAIKYKQENALDSSIFKTTESLANALRPYAKDAEVLQCPSASPSVLSYVVRTDVISSNDLDSSTAVIADKINNHKRYHFGNVLFGDGRVKGIFAEELEAWTDTKAPDQSGKSVRLSDLPWSSPNMTDDEK